jgi:beta-glucanase (GH16 family)
VWLALVSLAAGPGHVHAAWQLVWSDEFDGSTVDASKWVFETGNNNGWGNGEREYYTGRTNNAYVANGVLHIVARQESTNGFSYTSARMKTQGRFSQAYGRFEFRAKLPQGVGFWPALWMMGANISSVGWPACGEIDVMELNGSWAKQVQGTIHYSDASNNQLQQTKLYTLPASGDSVTNFHTYAVEWATNSIKWVVDEVAVQTWTSWSSSTGPYPAPFNQPFFILMNLAIGGSYLGYPSDATIDAGTTFPGEMQLDYVRVYAAVSTPPDPPTGLITAAGNATVFLAWDPSNSGATGYNLKRATASGGPYTTVASPAANSYADTGLSTCTTYYYVVSATNSVGESTNSAESSVTVPAFELAVNSGGGAAAQFAADAWFTGGTQATPVTAAIDTTGVVSPAPQAVYQSERFGNFTYTFTSLTSGLSYKLRLHFAETYWTSAGQRLFNVLVNGTQVLRNFDIVATAGAPNKATIQEFTATPNAGQISIQYVTVKDNAKSSGIELLIPPPPSPAASNNSPIWAGMTLNLAASSIPGATYFWTGPNGFSSTSQNPSIPGATTNATGTYSVTATVGSCTSPPATITVTVNQPPSIAVGFSNGNAVLSWPAGTLQSATNLPGPWQDVAGATSPYTNSPTLPQEFYRLRLP